MPAGLRVHLDQEPTPARLARADTPVNNRCDIIRLRSQRGAGAEGPPPVLAEDIRVCPGRSRLRCTARPVRSAATSFLRNAP